MYCAALRWVVRFSPPQAVGTERSPVVVPTTSSFYKGYPLEGKPPTEAELSFKAKCTQALLLNLGSRLGLHGGWDPEEGATFVVWTNCRAVVAAGVASALQCEELHIWFTLKGKSKWVSELEEAQRTWPNLELGHEGTASPLPRGTGPGQLPRACRGAVVGMRLSSSLRSPSSRSSFA